MLGQPTGFWGKLHRDRDDRVVAWHPLIDHCADVAAVTEGLLRRTLLRARLARLGSLDDLDDVQASRLSVLAALHDIGKFNIGFQNKALGGRVATAGHLTEVLSLFSQAGYPETSRLVDAIAFERIATWFDSAETACAYLIAAISHHGRPMQPGGVVQRTWWARTGILDPFAGMRALREATAKWFPASWQEGGRRLPAAPELQHGLSGLVMLADWLGSDDDMFGYSEDSQADRMATAREVAARAIAAVGLEATGARAQLGALPVEFGTVSEHAPRPAQLAVASMPLPSPGSVTVLEAETGSGKTEAALCLFARLLQAGEVDGMYFALPTRTAATQIHERVVQAARRAFPDDSSRPGVVLAVPGYLRVDSVEGQPLPDFDVLWPDDKGERSRHRGWAAESPKRYLAGAIVVGTIDQVLLSTLQVRHSHLRASALLRHLLVVDEVHASDAYMNRLLEEVLKRHVLSHGHALLMSATLGARVRDRMLRPGSRGQGVTYEQALAVPYPLVVTTGGRVFEVTAHSATSKHVVLELQPILSEPARIASQALQAASQGAKVLVLRNTVAGCREAQQAIEDLAGEQQRGELLFRCQGVVAPHHARYAGDDRRALDEAIERSFGKEREPGGCVVVATQTVQQSLDLDADLLITDLCPMDVLLQRIGRLHRHERPRPQGFERACACVLTPAERDLATCIQQNGEARGKHGMGTVYADLRVLEATWRSIEARPEIDIPRDNRLLVESAVHDEVLDAIVQELGGRWLEHKTRCLGAVLADQRTASLNLARWDLPFGEQGVLFPSTELDQRISTRLGEGDRVATFGQPFTSPFGQSVRELHVPAWWSRGVPADAAALVEESTAGELRFRFGDKTLLYDRLGLRPLAVQTEPVTTDEEDNADV